tara:strand:- start:2383 stop:2688 length:306 start_codon:yes stop_codon:yes gene_type:complete
MQKKQAVLLALIAILFTGSLEAANVTLKEINNVPELASMPQSMKQNYTKNVSKKKFNECVLKMKAEPKEADGKIIMTLGRGGKGPADPSTYMSICLGLMAF